MKLSCVHSEVEWSNVLENQDNKTFPMQSSRNERLQFQTSKHEWMSWIAGLYGLPGA